MLNNINHKMAIYKDCTLVELMVTAISVLITLTILFSFITQLLFGYLWPGYLLASALFFIVTRFCLSLLHKLKYGKPYGYYQQRVVKKLSELGLINNNYVLRTGKWSVRRTEQ